MSSSYYSHIFKSELEQISGANLTAQEAGEAFGSLAGFIETLIEIDKSLKNKGNDHANIGSTNILH